MSAEDSPLIPLEGTEMAGGGGGYPLPVYLGGLAIACLIAFAVYSFIFSKTHGVAAAGPTFIIAGPSGAGKTALFTLLRYGEKSTTLPSIEQNISTSYRLPSLPDTAKPFVLIDTPGHQKLRQSMFDVLQVSQAARTIHGVLFVVDASAVSKPEKLREAAEYLYDVLRVTEKVRGGSDVLVAANKSELFTAVPAKRLRTLLEAEVQKIRETRTKAIGKVGLDGEKEEEEDGDSATVGGDGWLGLRDGKPFRFEDLESDVMVVGGSVETGKVDDWVGWMEERAVN
ncbi:signal recognition particle receptor beta subunit-domain-containing protein [Myxozyma melibiosi]|uniref:Signal recognition particle receptor subunit beta n=1 Tax=Myxozyma melibiosi TaxID=54550 RepID=A0ABR1F256_9ASCO